VTVYRIRLVDSHIGMGETQQDLGKEAEALAEDRLALELCTKLVEAHPAVTDFQHRLGASRSNLGVLLSQTGRPTEAEVEFRKGVAILQKLADDHPTFTDLRLYLAVTYKEEGKLLVGVGRTNEAEAEFRKAQEILAKLVESNPKVPENRLELALTLGGLGDVNRRLGRMAEGRNDYMQAIAMGEDLVKECPARAQYRSALAYLLRRRGLSLAATDDAAGAAADARRALKVFDGLQSRTGEELFETACCHAALSVLAGRMGSGISADSGPTESTNAIEQLKMAIGMSYRSPHIFRSEKALDPLGNRDDFKKLLTELENGAEKK
jgi:tetratricopeptide (TPR) repeat protein